MQSNLTKFLDSLNGNDSEIKKDLKELDYKRFLLKNQLNTLASLKILKKSSITLIRNTTFLNKEIKNFCYILEAELELDKQFYRDGSCSINFSSLKINDNEYKKFGEYGDFIKQINDKLWHSSPKKLILSDDSGKDGFEKDVWLGDLIRDIFGVNDIEFCSRNFTVYVLMTREGIKKYKALNEKYNKYKYKDNTNINSDNEDD